MIDNSNQEVHKKVKHQEETLNKTLNILEHFLKYLPIIKRQFLLL